jgi:hypothetical protein
MNYEFHVGDYVETAGGFVGWVSYVDENDKSCICITDKCGTMSGPWHPLSNEYHFLRIGAYDFTKKEKKKIEMISECNRGIFANTIKPENHMARMVSNEIINKINELVDAVNELRDKEIRE